MSEAAPFVRSGARAGKGPVTPNPADGALTSEIIRRILLAAQDLDPLELQAQLDLGAAGLGIARCVDEIVLPARQDLRRMPATGERGGLYERLATEAIRAWLSRRRSVAPAPQDTGPILLACGPRDREVVALECLALLLQDRRWPCRVLGARIPPFALTIAAQASEASAVVVMSTDSRGLRQTTVSLRDVDALGVPVFFAGEAFEPGDRWRQLPGRYLGGRMENACSQVVDALTPALPRRSGAADSAGSEPRSEMSSPT